MLAEPKVGQLQAAKHGRIGRCAQDIVGLDVTVRHLVHKMEMRNRRDELHHDESRGCVARTEAAGLVRTGSATMLAWGKGRTREAFDAALRYPARS